MRLFSFFVLFPLPISAVSCEAPFPLARRHLSCVLDNFPGPLYTHALSHSYFWSGVNK